MALHSFAHSEQSAVVYCSGSLMKAMKQLRERFGMPAPTTGSLQERLSAQVEALCRESAREGFHQGFFRGAEAGVVASFPEGHNHDVIVRPLVPEYWLNLEGFGPVQCKARRRIVEGDFR